MHSEETWQDSGDEWDDEEDEEDDLVDYGDDEPTIRCPYCCAEIWEEALLCPECGQYISTEERQASLALKPLWIILGAILCLLLVATWFAL